MWHPVGVPTVWSLERWLSDNKWESEDGASRRELRFRDSYWDHPMTWIDDTRVAIGGIGGDAETMVDGVCIIDLLTTPVANHPLHVECQDFDTPSCFAGPTGQLFSDGRWLYSSGPAGLTRWDFNTGEQTGHLPGFEPTHHHRGCDELVQLVDGALLRWSLAGAR